MIEKFFVTIIDWLSIKVEKHKKIVDPILNFLDPFEKVVNWLFIIMFAFQVLLIIYYYFMKWVMEVDPSEYRHFYKLVGY